MKKAAIWGVLLFSLLYITGCSDDDKEKVPESGNVQIGDVLPDFSVTLNSGETVNKKSLEDKISVILFFTTTCPDCIALFPTIERIYEEFKEYDDIVILGIGRAQPQTIVDKFWEDNSYTLPYSAQETRDVYNLFAPSIVPRIYISNSNCIVEAMFTDDPIADYEELKSIIEKLHADLCCKT